MQTDYVDVFMNHAVNDTERRKNPSWQEFVYKAKRHRKIRFSGLYGHSGKLVECVDYALDPDLVDVLLLAQNFGQDPAFYARFTRSFDFIANQPDLPRVMKKAGEANIGVIGMKVLRGAKLNDMRLLEKDGHTYAQATFKWALASGYVDATVISMTSVETIDEYLGDSGQRQVTAYAFDLLEQYVRLTDLTYCRHACNDCQGACPYGVPIADMLRTRMYATDYGDLTFARSEYAQLGDPANACLSCDGKPCQDACTHGIQILRWCGPTHVMLS